MRENYFLIKDNPPKEHHADKHKKIMIAGKKLPWRIEDFRNADYFVNKGYTVWTFTHDPIEDEE